MKKSDNPIMDDSLNDFTKMLQNSTTAALAKITPNVSADIIDSNRDIAKKQIDDKYIAFQNYSTNTLMRVSTHKLLDAFLQKFTKENHYISRNNFDEISTFKNKMIEIPIDEYMDMLGCPHTKASKDKLRKRIKEDLCLLYNITFADDGDDEYLYTRLFQSVGYKNGCIQAMFGDKFADSLISAYIMSFPLGLFQIDERNATAYVIGKKLAMHASMTNNIKKGTADIISVKSLIEGCKTIPTKEEEQEHGRQYLQRIQEPFERALEILESIYDFEYCNAKKMPLTERQLNDFNFATFYNSYLHFKFK